MSLKYIINHKRFKNKFNDNEIINFSKNKNRISLYPQYERNYYDFFNTYAKNNYKLIYNNCLCGSQNDILLSQTDRHCVNFITVVCKSCGLIRAKNYFRNQDVKDFYQNFYRTNIYSESDFNISPSDKFKEQKKIYKFRFELLDKYKIKPLNNLKIVDIGGGVGGVLDHFNENNIKYLFDYFDPYLKYAKTKNIISVEGGLDKLDFKPDIIILSHVIEHWNNFEQEIQNLIKVQKKNETLNYIEFPGVDSLKYGRRGGDILGDIHIPHVYYFTSYVFENLMNRYGFEKIYLDKSIKSIFVYTGNKKGLINHFELCQKDLRAAEKVRKMQIIKNLIKLCLPTFILKVFRKLKKIN